jgi:RimJ/RimL family protein N-acetyltransferase
MLRYVHIVADNYQLEIQHLSKRGNMSGLSQQDLVRMLPMERKELIIRTWSRRDIDILASWPGYPFPYEVFNNNLGLLSPQERDEYFQVREDNPDRITLVVDHKSQPVIGYCGLVEIDWKHKMIGNMGYRIHPAWCGKGIGTRVMQCITEWCFGCGIQNIKFDVAASNLRAVRCYKKAGYIKTGEFWRDDEGLKNIDITKTKYDFLRPHVSFTKDIPRLRFWWMECQAQK